MADPEVVTAPPPRGLSFRAKLVLGVCGLVFFTGAVVLWLAHRSARASTEALTGSVFREVSGRAATHTRGYVLQAGSVPGTTCAAPVTDAAGRLRGVLTADFTLATLSEFVAGVPVSEHSRVFLFTDDQVLLAHPDHRGGAAARAGRLLSLAESGDPLVDAYRAHLRPDYLRPADGDE